MGHLCSDCSKCPVGQSHGSHLSQQERDQSGKGVPRFIFIVNLSFAFPLLLVSASNNSRMAGIDKVWILQVFSNKKSRDKTDVQK